MVDFVCMCRLNGFVSCPRLYHYYMKHSKMGRNKNGRRSLPGHEKAEWPRGSRGMGAINLLYLISSHILQHSQLRVE